MKLYCLSLYYMSPSAYLFLRNTFSIPSVRTLQIIFDKFQIDCGFSADLLSVLKKRVCTMSEKDRLCNVCIDEMSLKCGLQDRIDGFVNMDCGGSQEISKHGEGRGGEGRGGEGRGGEGRGGEGRGEERRGEEGGGEGRGEERRERRGEERRGEERRGEERRGEERERGEERREERGERRERGEREER